MELFGSTHRLFLKLRQTSDKCKSKSVDIIVIIIIIIIFIPFIYCIHSYVPRQTTSIGDTLLQLLFRFIVNTLYGAYLPRSYVGSNGLLRQHFPENVCAVPNMAVFCSSRTSWLPGMLPTYFLNHFEMVPVAPIITGITVVFTFHIRSIYTVRSTYFKIFLACFLITLLSAEMATSISMHVLFHFLG